MSNLNSSRCIRFSEYNIVNYKFTHFVIQYEGAMTNWIGKPKVANYIE